MSACVPTISSPLSLLGPMSKLWRRGSTSGAMEVPEPGEALELSLAGAHGHGVHKKKHKKHKKKHKKKHYQEEEAGPTQPSPAKPQLKLKIKLGGQVLGTKSVPTFTVIPEGPRSPSPLMVVDNEEEPVEGVPLEQYRAWLDEDSNLSPSPLRDLSGSLGGQEEEEEQRWLDALEKGELDDNGDLKKEINERLLTARQRALLQKARSQPSPMLSLPVAGVCPAPALTEEMLLKREERARKRRLQAARRAEEHKNQTIERLTKTAAPSGRGGRGATRGERRGGRAAAPAPMVRYSSGAQGSTLSFPPGVPAPAPVSPRPSPPGPPPRCSVPGCPHPRRYACSRTGQALCSLQCYRINLQMRLGGPEGPGSPLLAT
ncbi:INO80 complex subunit B isoform X2 [Camelus dromedarius]|uniref:INO80 complex subunit B n=3 Tax=Camelidae TaxID=9835 RepID=A0A8B6Y8M1_CAMFR|nr:INO80 complex subunit B [Camelus ferus]XP_006219109.1 INO80 complex subunit B [Vicugna pacos]XP_010998100.2 INO80 complex subunit B isoform X2 [Camelus dromedarius]